MKFSEDRPFTPSTATPSRFHTASTLSYRNNLVALDIAPTPRGILMATGSEADDVNVMHFFDEAADIASYATSVLEDIADLR